MTQLNTGASRREPPRWQWVLSTVSAAGVAAVDIVTNRVADLGWILWPCLVVIIAWMVTLLIWQIHGRRSRRWEAVDAPADVPAGSTSLPYASGFTGRDDEVAWIVSALDTEHAVAVIGRRGVGTSSCAVQAANLTRSRFPRGQIYINLRVRGHALREREVLAALARAVGVPEPRSGRPADLARTTDELWAGMNHPDILLVLDNVDSTRQVRSLLPPRAQCRILLAGSPGLWRINGVAVRLITEPGPEDSVELFATAWESGTSSRRMDPRTDPRVREIIELCGRQPRTIRSLGYGMARHGWRSADVLANLRFFSAVPAYRRVPLPDAMTLLTDRDVAYRALRRPARRLYRLLSLAPRPVDRASIGALSRMPVPKAGRLLDTLETGEFVAGAAGSRHEIRPLLHGYARLHLRRDESTRRRTAALVRLLRHLARLAERHSANLPGTTLAAVPPDLPGTDLPSLPGLPGLSSLPGAGLADADPPGPPGSEPSGLSGPEPSDLPGIGPPDPTPSGLPLDEDPCAWFELHTELLHALVQSAPHSGQAMPVRVRRWWFRLAVALCGWYAYEHRLDDWQAVCESVLAAPTADDRPKIAGWAHNELGVLCRRVGDAQGAVVELRLALAQGGRRVGGQARMNLGLAMLDLGEVSSAIEHLEAARRHRARGDRAGRALSSLALGSAYLAAGHADLAHQHLVRAANEFGTLRDSARYAAALTNLVLAQWQMGEYLDATQSWRAALRAYKSLADPSGQAAVLLNAGAALVTAAPDQAEHAYQLLSRSAKLREKLRAGPGHGRTQLYLGDAQWLLGHREQARRHWTDAARICGEVDDGPGRRAAKSRLSGGLAPDPAASGTRPGQQP